MNKIAILETWTESEADWGQRPDGCSLHLTKDDCESYIKKYWDKMPKVAPHEYSRPDGNLKVVKVSDDFYREIKKSNGGLRLWRSEHNRLEEDGKIQKII